MADASCRPRCDYEPLGNLPLVLMVARADFKLIEP
jgi:hypothetical protein